MEQSRTQKHTVVLVPLPLQGHMTPMLQLGSILYSKGFSIVVAHSEFRPPNPLNHPGFIFHPLSDNLSGYDGSMMNIRNLLSAINSNCRAPLQEYMIQFMEDQKKLQGYQVSCIIYDLHLFFVDSVATRVKIPGIVFRPNLATYMLSYHCIFQLRAQNHIPFPESRLQEPVPGLYPLRFKNLPHPVISEIPETNMDFAASSVNIRSSVAIIGNTTDYLEHSALLLVQQRYKVPFFPIGPLHKMAAVTSTSFLEEDQSCIAWLDKQAPNSVLYISLGSIACINEQELIETAWGLANSGIQFLWVLRSDSIIGSQLDDHFPDGGFKALVGEKGIIVKWAPQRKVLAHRAVGGFWSHCGWNSTIESICEGVPMICRPYFADQLVNTRFLTYVWKVGLEIENVLHRGSIEKSIRRLMIDAEGKEMRQRMSVMKDKLEAGLQKGGSSYESLSDLTEFISQFPSMVQEVKVDVPATAFSKHIIQFKGLKNFV